MLTISRWSLKRTPAFKNDRSLDEADQAALLEWIAAGAPNDVALDEPLENRAPVGNSLREDVVLTMPEPYIPTGDLADDYRCFLLDPQLPEGGFVTGSNVIPGDRRVVHHVILFQAAADSRAEAEEKAAEDDRPGWECFGGPELSSSEPGGIGNSVGIWVPGSDAMLMDEETGVYVPPGGLVVMQVHYNYSADFYPDQTSAVLQVESADSDMRGIEIWQSHCCGCVAKRLATMQKNRPRAPQAVAIGVSLSMVTWCKSMAICTRRVHRSVSRSTQMGQTPLFYKIYRYGISTGRVGIRDNARYITWGEGTNDEMCLNMATIKPAAGFEERAGRALFVDSFTIYPNWMPAWARIFMMMLRSLSTGVKIVAGAVIALMFASGGVYGIKIIKMKRSFSV